jgi:hypothetical protein
MMPEPPRRAKRARAALADTEIKAAAARRAACLKSEIGWLLQQR